MNRPLIAVVAVTLFALSGCGGGTKPEAAPSFATEVSAPASAPPSPTSASPKVSPSKSQASGPQIVYFRIKTKPSCPSSGPATSFPGNPIVLEWKVTGVTNVTISIDGPGIFGTYDATYSHEFPFSCSGASGSTQKHTYLLKTVGGGPVKEQKITGEARVN